MDAIIVRRNPVETRALSLVQPSMFDEIDRWAGEVWNSWTPTMFYHDHRRSGIPMDIYETKDGLFLKAELPGFRKEDVDISLEGDYLTIKAVSKQEKLPKDSTFYLDELCYGEYTRSVTLPFPVDSEKISATFENGILQMSLPKTEESKPKRIEVKVK